MEEGYDWDQIGNFQIVDGINISTPLLNDELLIPSSESNSNIATEQREFPRQLCSLSQFLGSSPNGSKNIGQRQYIQQVQHNCYNLNQNYANSSTAETQPFPIQSDLTDSNTNSREDLIYNYGFTENNNLASEKEFNKRRRSYSSSNNRLSNSQSNASGVVNSSINRTSNKVRTRKARDNSDEYSNIHSKVYPSGDNCSFNSNSNISEDLNSIKYYEGFKLPLGDLGRKMLLKKLREIHTQNPTKMEKALTDHGLSYTRIRFASVQQLFKISYVCDVFDYALSIHCEFGRPRHRDSSKSVQISSNNSNSSLLNQSSNSNLSSSRRTTETQSNITEKYENHNNLNIQHNSNIVDDSSKNMNKLDVELDTYTPDTSPCSHRSYNSNKSLYSKDSSLISTTPLNNINKVEHDITSPMSIFSTTSSSPASQKKRRNTNKSSYHFTPPPIPVTNSPIQSIQTSLNIDQVANKDNPLNTEVINYMNPGNSSGLNNALNYNAHSANFNSQHNMGIQKVNNQLDLCNNHYSDNSNINNRRNSSYTKKTEEQEGIDTAIPSNNALHKHIVKRQKLRSKKKNTPGDLRNDNHTSYIGNNYFSSSQVSLNVNNGYYNGEYEEIYISTNTEVTPFYQPESEIAHLGNFDSNSQSHDSISFNTNSDISETNSTFYPYNTPFETSLILSTSIDTDNMQSGSVTCESPTSFYLYTQPGFCTSLDEYVDTSNFNGILTHGLNSIELLNSSELEVDNIDISCPLISI